jgi:hypothetical protein
LRDVGATSSPPIEKANEEGINGSWDEENNRNQGGVQNPARLGETHTPPRCFPSFDDETAWKPHAASFLLPVASKTRRCGVHTPPRFHSFLRR